MNFSSRAFPCGRACRNEDGESTGAIKGAPCYTGFNYADSKPIHFCQLITFEAIIVKSKRRRSVFPNKVGKGNRHAKILIAFGETCKRRQTGLSNDLPRPIGLICCYFRCFVFTYVTRLQFSKEGVGRGRGGGPGEGNYQELPTRSNYRPFKLVSHSITDEIDSCLRRLNKASREGLPFTFFFLRATLSSVSLQHFDDKGAKFHCDSGTTQVYYEVMQCALLNQSGSFFYQSVLLKGQRGTNRPPAPQNVHTSCLVLNCSLQNPPCCCKGDATFMHQLLHNLKLLWISHIHAGGREE